MDTKERILKAAYEEFAANGYSKSSLGAIADVIGITRPALYYHYKSKEDLFLAVYNSIDPLTDVDITKVLRCTDTLSYHRELSNTIYEVIGHFRSDEPRIKFIAHVENAASYLPSIDVAAHEQDNRLRSALEAALSHGVEIGAFSKEFPVDAGVEYLALAIYGIGEVMLRRNHLDLTKAMPFIMRGVFGS